jgi:hypothetical protein
MSAYVHPRSNHSRQASACSRTSSGPSLDLFLVAAPGVRIDAIDFLPSGWPFGAVSFEGQKFALWLQRFKVISRPRQPQTGLRPPSAGQDQAPLCCVCRLIKQAGPGYERQARK